MTSCGCSNVDHTILGKTTEVFMKTFPIQHAFSSCPNARLCQTCAALLKCWLINVHKHFKHRKAVALELLAWTSCFWWGYCFRQLGKVKTGFLLGEESSHGRESHDAACAVRIGPRINAISGHGRNSVTADL